MSLTHTPVSKTAACAQDVQTLYTEAFPEDERIPFGTLCNRAQMKNVHFNAWFDGTIFCGMTYTLSIDDFCYVLYLAISSNVRSHGYGTKILDALKVHYASLALDIEPVVADAPNYDQRVRRLAFYKRNGFKPSGYEIEEDGERYTILSTADTFDQKALLHNMTVFNEGRPFAQIHKAQ